MAAGFVLWQVHDMYSKKNKKDAAISSRVREMEDKRQKRYDELLDNLEKRQNDLYDVLLENQKSSEERYQELIDKILNGINQPHILSSEENQRMTKIDEEIDIFLERTLAVCNASRVSLIKFHNGGNDMLGNSILKMSMSNEKCAAGVTHNIGSFQNQLRSFSTYLMKELNERGLCFIENVENVKNIDTSLYEYFNQTGTKSFFAIAIHNIKDNTVIGFISIEYTNCEYFDMKQVKHCLKDKQLKIEAVLNL